MPMGRTVARTVALAAVGSLIGLTGACAAGEPPTPQASVGDNAFCVLLDNLALGGYPRWNIAWSGVPTDVDLVRLRNRLIATAQSPEEFDAIYPVARARCVEMNILSAL